MAQNHFGQFGFQPGNMDPESLPAGWEKMVDVGTGWPFFIDHNTKQTTWQDPRMNKTQTASPGMTSQSRVREIPVLHENSGQTTPPRMYQEDPGFRTGTPPRTESPSQLRRGEGPVNIPIRHEGSRGSPQPNRVETPPAQREMPPRQGSFPTSGIPIHMRQEGWSHPTSRLSGSPHRSGSPSSQWHSFPQHSFSEPTWTRDIPIVHDRFGPSTDFIPPRTEARNTPPPQTQYTTQQIPVSAPQPQYHHPEPQPQYHPEPQPQYHPEPQPQYHSPEPQSQYNHPEPQSHYHHAEQDRPIPPFPQYNPRQEPQMQPPPQPAPQYAHPPEPVPQYAPPPEPQNPSYMPPAEQPREEPQPQPEHAPPPPPQREEPGQQPAAHPTINQLQAEERPAHSRSPSPAPPNVTPLEHIGLITEEAENLRDKVESFAGTKRDKAYLYLEEMLTRLLIKLDRIDSEGKDEIRQARKNGVRIVQGCLDQLELKGFSNAAPRPSNQPAANHDPSNRGQHNSNHKNHADMSQQGHQSNEGSDRGHVSEMVLDSEVAC